MILKPFIKILVRRADKIEENIERTDNGLEHSFRVLKGPDSPFSLHLRVEMDCITRVLMFNSSILFWVADVPVFSYVTPLFFLPFGVIYVLLQLSKPTGHRCPRQETEIRYWMG